MNEQTGFRLLIATFNDERTAASAVDRLLGEFKGHRAALPAAAWVIKDAAGKLTIRETADIGTKQGAAAGALAGGLVGLLSRRRSMVGSAALGALLGGVVAKKLDTGIPDPRLEAIGRALDESTSAAVAIVGDAIYDQAHRLMTGLQASIASEPFARETDFMKQLQAGDLSGAARTLADQAEGAVAGATTMAVERAEALSERGRAEVSGYQKEPATTDEEEIEIAIGPSAAAAMTGSTGTATPGVPVRPDDAMKPVPEPPSAELADDKAQPDSDAGGLARNDIDPAGAGVANIRPPV